MTITELSIKRPTLVIIAWCAIFTLGVIGYFGLSYEMLPGLTIPFVSITTVYPGASPEEVETSVSKKIEDAVSGIDKVVIVQSISTEGVSAVTVEFQNQADVDLALQDVQRKVKEIEYLLPAEAKTPTMSKIAFNEQPIMRIAAASDRPPREFYTFLTDRIKPQLTKISGVAQIDIIGGEKREIRVNLDRQKLDNYGFSIAQVDQAIRASNLDFPTGIIKDADEQYVVRVAGKITDLEVLRRLIVGRSASGGDIRLSDVAEVQDGRAEITQVARLNGVPVVGILIKKQSDANAVDVSRKLKDTFKNLESDYAGEHLQFTIVQDDAEFTNASSSAVMHDILIAILLVALVMYLFLHSLRNSLMVLITIPISIVSTFFVLEVLGYTLNVITLLGMSCVIGIVVDDAIVVLENIYRHMELGKDRMAAAKSAIREIVLPAVSIALVIVTVMLPLCMVQGFVSTILRQYSTVIMASTLFSLAVSFTMTPMLASRFSILERRTTGSPLRRVALAFERYYAEAAKVYERLLSWSLGNRMKVIGVAFVAFVLALSLIPLGFIGTELAPSTDDGDLNMTIETAPGTKPEDQNRITREVEKNLARIPELRLLFPNVGTSSDILSSRSANNISSIQMKAVPKSERRKTIEELRQEARAAAAQVPGVRARMNTMILGMSSGAPIQILVTGSNRDDVTKAAAIIEDIVLRTPGATDVRLSSELGKPEMRVEIDRDKMALLGLNLAQVGTTLRVALTGDDESKFTDGQNQYDIRVMLDQFDRTKTSDLGCLSFTNAAGKRIELQQFARIERATGPAKLERADRNASITIHAEAAGRGSGTVAQDIQQTLKNTQLPKGVSIAFKGQTGKMNETFASMGLAFLAAILFVYMILVALFDSFLYPFVVLLAIPGALIGAILALALAMQSLNMLSALGIIMLIGLVTKNSILLIDRANQVRKEHNLTAAAGLMEAAKTRLRPILMTTIPMILGMMPLALATNPGSELKTGLGWAMAGGLTSGMFITLLLVPVVYAVLDQVKARLSRVMTTRQAKNVPPAPESISEPALNTSDELTR